MQLQILNIQSYRAAWSQRCQCRLFRLHRGAEFRSEVGLRESAGGDHDLLHELIKHLVSQLGDILVLSDKGDEPIDVRFL